MSHANLPRRQMIMTSLITGFTLATARAEAGEIETLTTGLVAGEVQIPEEDGVLPGYCPPRGGRSVSGGAGDRGNFRRS